MSKKQSRYPDIALLESILVTIAIAVVLSTVYFVWHTKQTTDKTLNNAANSKLAIVKPHTVTDFASCKTASGSKLLESSPEQCVTKDGRAFADVVPGSASVLITTSYLKLPQAFKTAYVKHAISGGEDCVAANGLPNGEGGTGFDPSAWYITDKYVSTLECNTAAIYANVKGTWTFVAQTQFDFNCDTLHKFMVPESIVTRGSNGGMLDVCLDANNHEIIYHQAAV